MNIMLNVPLTRMTLTNSKTLDPYQAARTAQADMIYTFCRCIKVILPSFHHDNTSDAQRNFVADTNV